MRKLIFVIILCCNLKSLGQEKSVLKIGEQIQGLLIQNVEYFDKKSITTQDLLGRWTILDFWTTGCTACVKSFPKINELQRKFKQIQFVLITNNSKKYSGVRKVYEKFRKNMNLELPIAYDSVLFKKFAIHAVPFIVVIDPKGMVHSLPVSTDINAENLNKLVTNQLSAFPNQVNEQKKIWKYWINASELKENNKTFQSMLSPYQNEWTSGNVELNSDTLRGVYQVTRASVEKLYLVAHNWYRNISPHHNAFWPKPVFESTIINELIQDEGDAFNYSLMGPSRSGNGSFLRGRLMQDLDTYFGTYGTVEVRTMPYWRLRALPSTVEKLKGLANKHKYKDGPTGLDATGIDITNIVSFMVVYFSTDLPIVDETNIKGKIDLTFEAVMTDVQDVQQALKEKGLILEKAYREMKVLVIKDTGIHKNPSK